MGNFSFKQVFQSSDRIREANFYSDPFNSFVTDGFYHDKEVIIFSRSFRRLLDKTQIYPVDMGDHYRTRLTHTLEVAQIAGRIAQFFDFDIDLCEAISYGHDLGHTPFGHSGERILNKIMSGEIPEMFEHSMSENYGGFNHNFQSVRILDIIETNDSSVDGINLSWQVLEGSLKHTKSGRSFCNLESFVQNTRSTYSFFMDYDFSVTFEGQVVHVADEIAQMLQDLNDGFKSPEARLDAKSFISEIISSSDEIISSIQNKIDSEETSKTLKSSKKLQDDSDFLNHEKECLDLFRLLIEELKKDKPKTAYQSDHLQKILMSYFLSDVLLESKYRISKNCDSYKKNVSVCIKKKAEKKSDQSDQDDRGDRIDRSDRGDRIDRSDRGDQSDQTVETLQEFGFTNASVILSKCIDFSKVGHVLNLKIKDIINSKITNTDFVNKFDSRAQFIIRNLFEAYYENPLLLPFYVRLRIQKAIRDNKQIYDIKLLNSDCNNFFTNKIGSDSISLSEVDMTKSNRCIVHNFIHTLKLSDVEKLNGILELPDKFKLDEKTFKKHNIKRLNDLNKSGTISSMDEPDRFVFALFENNISFARCICDYIAGMSDNYAMKEYRALFIGDI
ncbi:MAG: dNTP triphosphohydrolase [Methanosarcinaceae archaeon]|nr:dNTP triphosphohydrolase [Methanosarcinaceae archaeon]